MPEKKKTEKKKAPKKKEAKGKEQQKKEQKGKETGGRPDKGKEAKKPPPPAKGKGRARVDTTMELHEVREDLQLLGSPDRIGEVLVQKGLISRHQLFNALNVSYAQGCSLREALVLLKYLDDEVLDLALGCRK